MNSTFSTPYSGSAITGVGLFSSNRNRSSNQHAATPGSNYKEIFHGTTSPSKRERFLDKFKRRRSANTADVDENASTKQIRHKKSIISKVASMHSLRSPSRDGRGFLGTTNRVGARTLASTKIETKGDDCISEFGYFPRRRRSLGDILGTLSNKVSLRHSKVVPVIPVTPESIFATECGPDVEELDDGRLWIDRLLDETPPKHRVRVMEGIGRDTKITEEDLKAWIHKSLEGVPRNNLNRVIHALSHNMNVDILKAMMRYGATELSERMNECKLQDFERLLDFEMEPIAAIETWGRNSLTARSRESLPERSASGVQSPTPTASYIEHIIRSHTLPLKSSLDKNPARICSQECNCKTLQSLDQRPTVTICEIESPVGDTVLDSYKNLELKVRDTPAISVIRTIQPEETETKFQQASTMKLSRNQIPHFTSSEIHHDPQFCHDDLDSKSPQRLDSSYQRLGLEPSTTRSSHNEEISQAIKLTVQRMTKNFHSDSCSDGTMKVGQDIQADDWESWIHHIGMNRESEKISPCSSRQVSIYQQKERPGSSGPVKVIFPKTVNLHSHSQNYHSELEAINAIYNYKLSDLSNFCIWNPDEQSLHAYSIEDPVPNPADLKCIGLVLLWLPAPQNVSHDAVSHEDLFIDSRVPINYHCSEDSIESTFEVALSEMEQRTLASLVPICNVMGKDLSGFEDNLCLDAPLDRDRLRRLSRCLGCPDFDTGDISVSDDSLILVDTCTAREYLGSDYSSTPSSKISRFEATVEDTSRTHQKQKEVLPRLNDSLDTVMVHLEDIEKRAVSKCQRILSGVGGVVGKAQPRTSPPLSHFDMLVQHSGQVIKFIGATSSPNAGIEISHIEDIGLHEDLDYIAPKYPKELDHQHCTRCFIPGDKTWAPMADSIVKLDNYPGEASNLAVSTSILQSGLVAQSLSTSRRRWVPYRAACSVDDDNEPNLNRNDGSAASLEAEYCWKHNDVEFNAAKISTNFNQDAKRNKLRQSSELTSYDSDDYDCPTRRDVNYRSASSSSVSDQVPVAGHFWSSGVSLDQFPSGFKFTAHAAQLADANDVEITERNSMSSGCEKTSFGGEERDLSKTLRPDFINLDFEVSGGLREAEIERMRVSDVEPFDHAFDALEALRMVTPEQLNIRFIGKAARQSPLDKGKGKVGALVNIFQSRGLMPQSFLKQSIIRTGSPSCLLHQVVLRPSSSSLRSTPPKSTTSSRPMSRMSNTEEADDDLLFGESLEKCEKHNVKENNSICRYEEELYN